MRFFNSVLALRRLAGLINFNPPSINSKIFLPIGASNGLFYLERASVLVDYAGLRSRLGTQKAKLQLSKSWFPSRSLGTSTTQLKDKLALDTKWIA